jgi:hypothetical protein
MLHKKTAALFKMQRLYFLIFLLLSYNLPHKVANALYPRLKPALVVLVVYLRQYEQSLTCASRASGYISAPLG